MYLSRGQRIKLSDLCESKKFTVKILLEDDKNFNYDISCFGLDEFEKCSDDKFFIFYNQKKSPCNSINLLSSNQNKSATFEINLSSLPQKIKKLVFTITIDGNGIMSEIRQGSFILFENGNPKGGFKFNASDFNREKSIIVTQIYFKTEWRFSAVGIGFNGGLSSLLENFGIQEEKEEKIKNNSVQIQNNSIQNQNIKQIDLNNNNNNNSNPNKFSSFVKNILSIPQKYTDKKTNERKFQELLRDFLSDGILTIQEMNKLQRFCTENNLNLQESLAQSQQDIESFLRVMLADIVSDNIVSKEEEAAINSVCHFLKPSLSIKQEINETIKRVKLLQEIRTGNISPLTNHSIITPISELVWYCEQNIQLIRELKRETKSHNGELFVTSERIIFKSYEYPVEILLKNILNIEVDGSYFYINGKTSKSTVRFRLSQSEILEAYIEQSLNKFYRKLNLNQTANKTRTIPQNVKQEVWIRDNGKCVQCGAGEYLEFDHVIPFSKGGANSSNNIQLLCRKCNLSKSDKI